VFLLIFGLLGEVDLRGFAVGRISLEVLIPVMEAGHIRPDAIGELANVDVVVLEDLVVALAFDGDAVFGSGQLIGEPGELLVALQVGVLLLEPEERPKGDVELGVGVDVACVVSACGENAGAGIGDVGQDSRLFGDVAFDRCDKVGDEVEAALLHDVDLREGLVDCFILLHQRIFRADVAASYKEEHNDKQPHNPKHNPYRFHIFPSVFFGLDFTAVSG
jgi:hypothetical protein